MVTRRHRKRSKQCSKLLARGDRWSHLFLPPSGETNATGFTCLPAQFACKATPSYIGGKAHSIRVFVVVPRFWRSMGERTANLALERGPKKVVLVSEPERNAAAE